MAWVAAQEPTETVLDGGPAKCKSLDSDYRKSLLASGGKAADMDADWVATDRALHFLRFNSGHANSWRWDEVQGADVIGKGLISATVRIRLSRDDAYALTLGRQAAKALLAIVAERARGRTTFGDDGRS